MSSHASYPTTPTTDLQARWALGVSHGLGPTIAAQVAGYANPSVAGARLVRDPRVRAIIRERRNRRLDKLASLSLCELEALIKDRKVSAAVRFNAIKLSLALAGHVEPRGPEIDEDDGKRVAEMTVDELDTFIAEERAKRANAAKPVIDATPADANDGAAQPDPGVAN
jgi:phage terminase small subunit